MYTITNWLNYVRFKNKRIETKENISAIVFVIFNAFEKYLKKYIYYSGGILNNLF